MYTGIFNSLLIHSWINIWIHSCTIYYCRYWSVIKLRTTHISNIPYPVSHCGYKWICPNFVGRQNKNALATVCAEMKASPQQQFDSVWSKGCSGMLVSTAVINASLSPEADSYRCEIFLDCSTYCNMFRLKSYFLDKMYCI